MWLGTFRSNMYSLPFGIASFVHGRIRVDLPNIVFGPNNYEAPCEMEYLGTYRYGQKETGVFCSKDGTLTAKMGSLQISFVVESKNDTYIKGIYRIAAPQDMGTFELSRA